MRPMTIIAAFGALMILVPNEDVRERSSNIDQSPLMTPTEKLQGPVSFF